MFWADKLIETLDIDKPHIINDSKTPSGRAHVGALRGVLIHDVMFRLLKEKGFNVRYTFGVDDFDPLDEIPYGKDEQYEKYLGMPLCNVPPPPGSTATDMSDFYISEFFNVFKYLGVHAETYRLRDIYRAGEFDEPIDIILRNAPIVRDVYKKISGSDRSEQWYPFQVICENCQRIGTTAVTDYDGKEVTYTCRPDMVKWAKGCGHTGKVSPFSGNGKLPWKLEWVAKWATRGITVEGAGKDHTTKGGSRDVATNCLKRIFNKSAPLNIPYEFFLVEGAKMSSSRGIGVSAAEMAEFLPPEILRYLMLRPQPNRPINFSPDEKSVIKLFNEYDRTHQQVFHDTKVSSDTQEVYRLSEVNPEGDYFAPDIQLLQSLVQMPHINVIEEIGKRKEGPLTPIDLRHLERRIASIKYWLDRYASDDEKLQLQDTLPEPAKDLSATQRAFLNLLAQRLPSATWQGDKLQTMIFDVARITPIKQQDAFLAIYKALFGRELGPRAGNLFEYLDCHFLTSRFKELPYSKAAYWLETGITTSEFEAWLEKNKELLGAVWAHCDFIMHEDDLPKAHEYGERFGTGMGVIEFYAKFSSDGKNHVQRLLFDQFEGIDLDVSTETDNFKTYASHYLNELLEKLDIKIINTETPLEDISADVKP
jgi:lysyl-tRNA synthetase class 1